MRATESLVEGNTTFALDLYSRLKTNEGNLFFSPYSISTCLAMTYAGARGDTEKQMATALHFNQKQEPLHANFGDLQRELIQAARGQGVELNIANALWTQKGQPFLPAFLKVATAQYGAKVKQADFEKEGDAVAREINQWVATQTKGRIQNILNPADLDALTTLAVANAIYFKGAWVKKFDKRDTASQSFHLSASHQKDTSLMSHTDEVNYFEDETLQAVELPYAGRGLSMVILLPREIEGCSQLETLLNAGNLSTWLARMKMKEVHLLIPRFKMESSFKLNNTFMAMGMRDAFQRSADFSGITGTRDLFIALVAHKAWVEVNEEGAEATAATVVWMTRGIEPSHPTFRADHPFIFLIRHNRSGSILFLGRLADPT